MEMFRIEGGRTLNGTVRVNGSKNAALPILASTLAMDGPVVLDQIPKLQDVSTMSGLLRSMGASIERQADDSLIADTGSVHTSVAPYELVRQMRASVCVLGPLLTRFGKATVSLPGGCNIGHRPIEMHLHGLSALGAQIRLEGGYVVAEAAGLRGAEIDLMGINGPTVTGTCNVMVAATRAAGKTVIRNAAREPEVGDLARFLCAAGARIDGAGTSTLEIEGVEGLRGIRYSIIPDRIEAATLAIAAAITGGLVMIENAPISHMAAVISVLKEIGLRVHAEDDRLQVSAGDSLRPIHVHAEPYPGLPTDTQAQLMALLSLVPGESRITDNVFPERFMHAAELVRMGASIQVRGNSAVVRGVKQLSAAPVMASDLRASAALVIAALAAEGSTEIRRIYHLSRGYQSLEEKLNRLGAHIIRTEESSAPRKLPASHIDWRQTDERRTLTDAAEDDWDSRR